MLIPDELQVPRPTNGAFFVYFETGAVFGSQKFVEKAGMEVTTTAGVGDVEYACAVRRTPRAVESVELLLGLLIYCITEIPILAMWLMVDELDRSIVALGTCTPSKLSRAVRGAEIVKEDTVEE